MYIFSELLNKKFDTVEDCINAEAAYREEEAKKDEEKNGLKSLVDTAMEMYLTARDETNRLYDVYCNKVQEYVDKYGRYEKETTIDGRKKTIIVDKSNKNDATTSNTNSYKNPLDIVSSIMNMFK